MTTGFRAALASAACFFLAACVQAPSAPIGLVDISSKPAEKALLDGLKAYEDARYEAAQQSFVEALGLGLASPRDRAEAHKRLAFIDCAASRLAECEQQFREARLADPAFALDRAEAGHPIWGLVYLKTQAP